MPLPPELIALVDGGPISFYTIFARIGGSASAGLFMSQAVYWQPKTNDPEGWWYKSRKDWAAETYLSRSEQELARKAWRELGVLEEALRRVPATVHYRVDLYRLAELMRQFAGIDQPDGESTAWQKSTNQLAEGEPTARQESTNQMAAGKPTNTKSTSKTTAKTTSSRARSARKSTPAESAGGGIDPALELETDPVLSGVVGSLIEAVRHGPPVNDLRALVVTALRERGLSVAGPRIAAVIAAVNSRAPLPRGEGRS